MRQVSLRALLLLAIFAMPACDACKDANPLSPDSPGENMRSKFSEIWFSPNAGSEDLLQMFAQPELWVNARANITTFAFYGQNLLNNSCSICGPNTLDALRSADAVGFLTKNNIKIAIETESVKWHNCHDNRIPINNTNQMIANVHSMGGSISYIALDEPFMSGLPVQHDYITDWTEFKSCNFTIEETAEKVKEYIDGVGGGARVGLIEPYPWFTAEQIKSFVIVLEQKGVRLPFFHLDYATGGSDNFVRDIRDLRNFFASKGIPFGVILIGGDGRSHYSASGGALLAAERMNQTIGLKNQDHLLLQSWLSDRTTQDRRLYPNNLPETDATSMTGMANGILQMAR